MEIIDINNEKVISGLHTFLARPKEDTVATGYVGYLLQSWNVRKQIMTIAQGTKVLSLSTTRLGNVTLNFPTLPEQQKIANFLTAVDSKLQALKKKKELLAQYKKGVMQKLFSVKADGRPSLRFKTSEGNNFADWEVKTLGEVANLNVRQINKPKNKYLAIGIRSHCKGTFQKPFSDPSKIAMDKLFVIKEDDLIVNITFAWEGAIAIVKKEDEGGLVSHRFPTYTFNKEISFSSFFKYIIVEKRFRSELDLISPGGAGRNRVMNKKDFVKIKINLPHIEEQTKIANFLSAIDDKITNCELLITKAEQYKKGLLQQMFV